MAELPFELYKRHKYLTRHKWKRSGIIFQDEEHFEYIYNEYIHATKCDLCNKLFPHSKNRHLDHCHQSGDVRNIVCCRCNRIRKDNKAIGSNTGEEYIFKHKHTHSKLGYNFKIEIIRDGKHILSTSRNTLEKAIICRDEFIDANPGIYT